MIKYDTYETFQGWEIRKTDENNKHSWLKSVYKGKYTFVSDYLYSKHYAEKTAKAIVKALNAKEDSGTDSTLIYIFNQIWVGSYNIIGVGDSRENAIDEAWKAYRQNFSKYAEFDDDDKENWLKYYGINRESIEPIKINSGWVE